MQLISRGTDHRLEGTLEIPVSKYHAHRALVLAALAEGTSVIRGISTTRQVEWTVSVLRALGVGIEITDDSYLVTGAGGRFHGVELNERGSRGLDGLLNVGSSGTTLYFMTGLAALSDRPTTLTGMKYFRRRPIKALLTALTEMGVELESTNDCPPITVQPKRPTGGDVEIAGTLSQWVSGLLLTAPFAETDTTIHITGGQLNEQPYVDLTVRMMRHWGFQVEVSDDWLTYTVPANQTGTAADYTIPADIGSAAFGIAAAALHPADVLFKGLSAATTAEVDHPEAEFLDIAASMGVPMTIDEQTGWVRIRHDGITLKPFDVDATPIPDLLPILSVMANFAEGSSHLRNVGHVRLKESDRVAAMLQLNKMGGDATQEPTELHINGTAGARGTGAALSSFNDHRVLMSLAIAGTKCDGETSLTYPRAYRISYPTFLEAMTSIGLDIDVDAPSRDTGEDEEREAPASAPLDAEPLVLPIAVREYAKTQPDAPAVIEVGGSAPVTMSWGKLQDEADKVSQLLLELGVTKGDAVGVQLPNWSEFIAISLGAMQIGAVVTPIMPVFGPREVAMTLSRSRARVLFLPNLFRNRRAAVELVSVAEEAKQSGRRLHLEHVIVLQAENRDGAESTHVPPIPDAAVARAEAASWTWRYYETALASVTPDAELIASRMPGPDDVCQLLFTSGTTGEPKGVQHPYRTLGLATAMHVQRSGLNDSDRVYIPSPLAHQTGFLYGMLLAWRLGVASVIQPVWDGSVALDQAFGEARASFVQAATPFLTDLVDLVESGRKPKPESLRIFVATGAAVPRELARKATTVLDTAVLGAFGTTETCLATLSGPNDPPESMWGTDGRALEGITLRIVDDEGVELPVGTEGNYEFSSPTLFGGYLERPDLTADVFTEDGWYKTGDLAFIDEAGYLHVTGRVKDVINRGGEKVPVVEIENLLYQHPLVADIAIVAMPDPRLGERACAFVVPAREGQHLEFAAMQEYLNAHGVSKYYWPERLEAIDELPRNAVGKIQKNVLREKAAALVAQDANQSKER
ncbi:3-phosphoshikimate 1-carboxyvinyltransferase [Gryllotalpicola ginsengisoli]|uniref:3-phosphoshikimate 1-carboxyvinyltransferase n=1 Tax=Gryllotalpicola ginsengisoli TaxID=444608 RepID=UPI0003B449E9|nr:3-phosphoshikimate 1-carboxyvinyltransferase [Gryllotalpicola ginsengisoli]